MENFEATISSISTEGVKTASVEDGATIHELETKLPLTTKFRALSLVRPPLLTEVKPR